jgi:hypothetical protein
MATEKSSKLTSALAGTLVRVPSRPKTVQDFIEVSDGANDDIGMVKLEIPVDALVSSVKVATDDLGTGTTMHVGLYKLVGSGSTATFTAVDADAFAASVDVATAATAMTEYRFSAKNIDTINKKAWELAGESTKPTAYDKYYLGVSFPVGTTAAGTVAAIVTYIE